MNVKLKRLLLPLLRAVKEGRPISFRMRSAASQALFLIGKPAPKKQGGRLRREQKRATHKEETAKIREEVFKRAADGESVPRCEQPDCGAMAVELDHWESGSGRRRERQSVENCWALCRIHHELRTLNKPDAAFWNRSFGAHCFMHHYKYRPHIIHAEPAKAGGAP